MTQCVCIYKPSKGVTQSGLARSKQWVLEYDLQTKREPEPLMGWVSSEDTANQVRIRFDTKDEAIVFAEKKGWAYTVLPEQKKEITPRNYSDNFRYVPPKKK